MTRIRPLRPENAGHPVVSDSTPPESTKVIPPLKSDADAPTSSPENQWKGRQIDHFRLQRLLGSGSMSVVIQAEDLNLHRTVALKFLKKNVKNLDQKEQIEQFFREATCAASLEHPNIVRIHGFQQHQNRWYLIMEHMEGGSLLQLVERAGPLNPRRACTLLADAAAGIAEAHSVGIVHRDIKPSNLLLTRTARCKVADFGLVRPDMDRDEFRLGREPVGSRYFLAPEILRGEVAAPAADVYGLGATLYTVMAGRPPFPADDRDALDEMILHAPPPDICKIVPHAPPAIAELIIQAMNKNPRLRPTAQDFSAILRGELAEMLEGGIGSDAPSSSLMRSSVHIDTTAAAAPAEPQPDAQPAPVTTPTPPAAVPAPAARFRANPILIGSIVGALLLGIAGAALFLRGGRGNSPQTVAPATSSNSTGPTQQQIIEYSSLKARADVLMDRIAKVDPGQGMQSLIEQAATLRGEASGLAETRQVSPAVQNLKTLLELGQQIESLDSQRAQAAARAKDALVSRERAMSAGAVAEPGSPMAQALEAQQVADRNFNSRRFANATNDYLKAQSQFEAATLIARDRAGEQAAAQARKQQAETDRQVRDLQAQAADLFVKAKLHNDQAAATSALQVLDKALVLRPDDAPSSKLRSQVAAYLRRKPGDRSENSLGMVFSYCPGGSFAMGSSAGEQGRDDDENRLTVAITRPFYLGRTEVTQRQWKSVMGDKYKSPDGDGDSPTFLGPDMPMQNVSWNDAVAFCKRLSALEHRTYRLPTEAEWEYACRAGSTQAFAFGDSLANTQAQIDGSEPYGGKSRGPTPQRPQRVASFSPNAWNLYDMHGNVAEWCADWYAAYPIGDAVDPAGPSQPTSLESANRVVRGGSWCHPARTARSASRWNYSPVVKTNYIGFRVVLEADSLSDDASNK